MRRTNSWDGICRPDQVDSGDPKYSQLAETPPLALPAETIDLIQECPAVQTQLKDYSCTAQAVVSAVEFLQKKRNRGEYQNWSRLFVYYNARKLERVVGDGGVSIKGAIRATQKDGLCPETFWEYRKVDVNDRPKKDCYAEAEKHQVVSAYRLTNDLAELKACLLCGWPFVFSFDYDSPYPGTPPDDPGFVKVPRLATVPRNKRSAHSVMAVGYDDVRRRITFQNSKGTEWGVGGYGSLSYDYITDGDLCRDFWTIRRMEGVEVHRHPDRKR